MGEAPIPRLFASGDDLPLWIASGADPQLLLQLPWVVRHEAARADAKRFAHLLEHYTGPDGADAAAVNHGHLGLTDADWAYHERVKAWLMGPSHSYARLQQH